MELELRSYNMLEYNMFRQAQISFPGENDLHMILPDSVIAREKSGILIEYLQKVFCERCGMDLKVELEFRETQESKYRKNAAVQIAQEVENVIRHAKLNSKNEEPAQSEEAGTAEKKAEKKTDKGQQEKKDKKAALQTAKTTGREISGVDSEGTAIRMLSMEEISKESLLHLRRLPVRWVR